MDHKNTQEIVEENIMAKTFGEAEQNILRLFNEGSTFTYHDVDYTVTLSGKPTCSKGEPKTDIYIAAQSANQNIKEFKISFKKQNADFLENKTNAERAEQIFGNAWMDIIATATTSLKDNFLSRLLIYKNKCGKTEAGAITLGWKFELLNVPSGQLSGSMKLSHEQVIDIYSGTNLSQDKRDASINGQTIVNSGIANYVLFENKPVSSIQEAINSLLPIDEYVNQHPDVYFACKALNFRTFKQKYDGNRPLAVYVDWHVYDGKLTYDICFDTPLIQGGDYAYNHLITALDILNVKTTDDLNSSNVNITEKIYE